MTNYQLSNVYKIYSEFSKFYSRLGFTNMGTEERPVVQEAVTLQDQFVLFSKFGDPRSEGKTITLTQSDKWMKQAQILDGRKITLTDTGIAFNKFKARTIHYSDFLKFIDDLAREKHVESEEIKVKLITCGPPGVSKIVANPHK